VLVKTLLDAVGVALSGPAYVFQFMKALSNVRVQTGLSWPVVTRLAAQTVKGVAEMAL
jgi:pyrroline-5-carboxylate reductase